MLAPEDRRFFDEDLEARLRRFMAARTLFPEELLALADRAEQRGCRTAKPSGTSSLATAAFALSDEPGGPRLVHQLERISGRRRHRGRALHPHQPPDAPVLDIDDLYARMQARGIADDR